MPIVISKDIPAYKTLSSENIFCMTSSRAMSQDIRPLEIAVVNLMPTKETTETQLMRLLSNTPLQVNVTLVRMESHATKNTEESYLDKFYKVFSDIKHKHFDGMIVTGAPVEKMDWEDVNYWDELLEVFAFAEKYVTSTIYICWGAQAAMKYYYGIEKKTLDKKLFGVFENQKEKENEMLLKGLNDRFSMPHSRFTTVDETLVRQNTKLEVLASGKECGLSVVKSKDNHKFFFFGHSEYDRDTLEREYKRDAEKGLEIEKPQNYYDENGKIDFKWNSTANLLFYNWLNYYVYQVTPYKFEK